MALRVVGPGLRGAPHGGAWPLTLEKGTFDMSDGDATLDDLLLAELMRRLAAEEPRLAPYLRVVDEGSALQANGFLPDGLFGGRRRYGAAWSDLFTRLGGALVVDKARGACALIEERAGKAGPAADKVSARAEPAEPEPSLAPEPWSNPLTRHCGRCHDEASPATRRFPLDDPERLRRLFRRNPRLPAEMVRRIQSTAADHMPPRRRLPETEANILIAYIEGLRR